MKKLREILEARATKMVDVSKGFKPVPKAAGEQKFIDKHKVELTEYPPDKGEDARPTASNVKKLSRKPRMGYEPGEDKGVYEAAEDIDESFKVGDKVKVSAGPHQKTPHQVIHVFDDGSYNVKPTGLSPKQIKYRLGAARAKSSELTKIEETTVHVDVTTKTKEKDKKDKTKSHKLSLLPNAKPYPQFVKRELRKAGLEKGKHYHSFKVMKIEEQKE
jgi:hypothetical protein